MIHQYRLKLSDEKGGLIPSNTAYLLYAWMLEQIPSETADILHNNETRIVSQYISHNTWTVNMLGDYACEAFDNVINKASVIHLNSEDLNICERSFSEVANAKEFLYMGKNIPVGRRELVFASPTSFKQAGRYAIYPKEELMLQSLISKWNGLFPEYTLDDNEMLKEMNDRINIVDYELRTARFRLKGTAVPCFYGKIYIESRLPIVIQEIWNSLLIMSQYTGMGIKTSLGMGGCVLIK